jgi:hypothetical protein
MYRDINGDDRGVDVLQLQTALKNLGLYHGALDAVMNAETGNALNALYRQVGYFAPGSPPSSAQSSQSETPSAKGVADSTASNSSAPPPAPPITPALLHEIAFVPQLPAMVSALTPNLYLAVPEVIAKISTDELSVVAAVQPTQCEQIQRGMKVHIELLDGQKSEGQVADSCQNGSQNVAITPAQPINSALNGKDVKVIIVLQESNGDVLTVPFGALRTTTDGKTQIVKVNANDPNEKNLTTKNAQLISVIVNKGVDSEGVIEINPNDVNVLKNGDKVLIQREQ